MPGTENPVQDLGSRSDRVLASLELEQLTARKHHFSRRVLKGGEVLLLWSLRIYLLFMIAVVIYQIWSGSR